MSGEEKQNSINKPLLTVGDTNLKPKVKRSIVGRSGKQFESVDHYIAESIVQNYYPKQNQEDLELIQNDNGDSDISPVSGTEPLTGQETTKKNWIQRTCGPLNPGSLRGSIFALMSTALGAGAFALPKALFYNCGFVVGIIFLVFTGSLTLFSLNLLMRCSVMANRLNYPDLAEHCFGKWAGKTIQWALIIYVFGVICGYQIIVSEFFLQLIGSDWGWIDYDCSDYTCKIRDIQIVIVTFIVLPISLLRNFYALRHVTMFGVGAIFYAIIVVLAESPGSPGTQSDIQYVHWDWNLFTGYTSALFAYTCYTVVFPIRMELSNPVEKRITKIFTRAVTAEFVLYSVLAISGYFTIFGLSNPEDLILQQSNSVAMVISRIAMILFLFIAIPININPGRTQVINVINGNSDPITDENFNKKHHILVTAVFLFGPCAIGIFFPKINSVFSFLGGACSTLFGITFPALMYVKLNDRKWTSPSNLFLVISATLLTIIGYIAAVLSLLTAFDAVKV